MSNDDLEPPLTVWETIRASCPPQELYETKRLLGLRLVNEIEDLQTEIQTLIEIQDDYRSETDASVSDSDTLRQASENAFQRFALRQKIKLLLAKINDKSSQVPALNDPKDASICEYVYHDDHRPPSSSDSSSVRSLGLKPRATVPNDTLSKQPSNRKGTRSLSSASSTSSSSTLIQAGNLDTQKIGLWTLDEVIKDLRTLLSQERKELLAKVDQLQNSLDEERTFRSNSEWLRSRTPPSTNELKEFSAKLEAKCLDVDHKDRCGSMLKSPSSLRKQFASTPIDKKVLPAIHPTPPPFPPSKNSKSGLKNIRVSIPNTAVRKNEIRNRTGPMNCKEAVAKGVEIVPVPRTLIRIGVGKSEESFKSKMDMPHPPQTVNKREEVIYLES